MVELAGGAGLGDEAQRGVLVGQEVRVDDLDRDRATQGRLLRAVDAPHAADADQVEDVVAPRQRLADELVVRGRAHGTDREAARGAVLVLRCTAGAAVRAGSEGGCCLSVHEAVRADSLRRGGAAPITRRQTHAILTDEAATASGLVGSVSLSA